MGILRTNTVSGIEAPTPVTGSVLFDGSGDYLTLASSGDFAYGTGDFTWETWVYVNSFSGNRYVLEHGANGGTISNSGGSATKLVYYNSSVELSTLYTTGFGNLSTNTWYHLAAVRKNGTTSLYTNGILTTSASDSHNYGAQELNIGRYGLGGNEFNGYISNLRILKGTALYTSNFTPPTRELQRIGDTVLLCCNNPDSAGAEATGKTITVNGNAAASTFSPGLVRDFTYGTQFDGVSKFDTQGYFVPPSGTTAQRGGAIGVIAGGDNPSTTSSNTIQYINIASTGNALDFGDLTVGRQRLSSCASSTRGIFGGGYAPGNSSTIDFITISSSSNAVNFGNLSTARSRLSACSNSTRGIFFGGDIINNIDYITIASTGNSTSFGTLTGNRRLMGTCASSTRGISAGGQTPATVSTIEFVTISTTGNASTFGDLTQARYGSGGCSNATRGVFAGGLILPASTFFNIIDYITIASTGNAIDFGDLITETCTKSSCSSPTRGVFAGGYNPSPAIQTTYNIIDYVSISSTGNSLDFGDLTSSGSKFAGCSNSHGGIS